MYLFQKLHLLHQKYPHRQLTIHLVLFLGGQKSYHIPLGQPTLLRINMTARNNPYISSVHLIIELGTSYYLQQHVCRSPHL